MKKFFLSASLLTAAVVVVVSCSKTKDVTPADEISADVKAKVQALGFGLGTLEKHEDGYQVEGDIILTEEFLNRGIPAGTILRAGNEEQYRTTNLVNAGTGRVITLSVDPKLGSTYVSACDEVVRRYNAEGLRLTFQRVSSNGNIVFVNAGGNFLASAGFPTSSGNPYNQVKVNSRQLNGQPLNTIASVLAHEVGHCIGFRHTDYMDRSYSCGGAYSNEGASSVGAILIPGTPSGPDANSWMLACIGSGMNRPFNTNDKTALAYLYK
ncbi:MAG TPA: M57 family metalloprotease [Chitinophagaceae bacterium]